MLHPVPLPATPPNYSELLDKPTSLRKMKRIEKYQSTSQFYIHFTNAPDGPTNHKNYLSKTSMLNHFRVLTNLGASVSLCVTSANPPLPLQTLTAANPPLPLQTVFCLCKPWS